MTPRPTLPNQSKLLLTFDGRQRSIINKAAKQRRQSVAAYIRGLIDERHPATTPERSHSTLKGDRYERGDFIKYMVCECDSITQMIGIFRAYAAELEQMRDEGITLREIDGGHVFFETDDKALAKKFRFEMDRERYREGTVIFETTPSPGSRGRV